MATLTRSISTRSTVIIPASRPRLTMSLSRALGTIMPAGGRYSASVRPTAGIALHQDLLSQINDHKSITTDVTVQLDSSKPCAAVIDQGAQGMSRNAKGAFVTSLGSRPPSPPV
ncbi:hypothetical protein FOE78_11560 [Microlunatus elymi]|uniref:Uncharacterized protein n=1 Tax=Microlunatus elymi TaxID=2596828 RepID=A0A516PZ58_9ACTN|nr:hypothetical protein [Microlunatus elymi]QDP96456.1 hypothetical protein FOE78_11560 [Microlunatus elymi]